MRRRHTNGMMYNVLFPIWILVWFPSVLWVLLIPGNYLIDRLVLRWGLGQQDDASGFCRKHTWKVCLAGFASDFVASALLLGMSLIVDTPQADFFYDIGFALTMNPFKNLFALLITFAAIAFGGLLIYLIDRWILRRAGLDDALAKSAALKLALFTAPYLFLLPAELMYG